MNDQIPKFIEEKFLSIKEKELIFKSWKLFLKSNCSPEKFTERLYHHISLHCSFIAHYNRHGFIQTYFADPEDTAKFLSQFDKEQGCKSIEYGGSWWMEGEHSDINKAMIEEFSVHRDRIYKELTTNIVEEKRKAFEIAKAEYEAVSK